MTSQEIVALIDARLAEMHDAIARLTEARAIMAPPAPRKRPYKPRKAHTPVTPKPEPSKALVVLNVQTGQPVTNDERVRLARGDIGLAHSV